MRRRKEGEGDEEGGVKGREVVRRGQGGERGGEEGWKRGNKDGGGGKKNSREGGDRERYGGEVEGIRIGEEKLKEREGKR